MLVYKCLIICTFDNLNKPNSATIKETMQTGDILLHSSGSTSIHKYKICMCTSVPMAMYTNCLII